MSRTLPRLTLALARALTPITRLAPIALLTLSACDERATPSAEPGARTSASASGAPSARSSTSASASGAAPPAPTLVLAPPGASASKADRQRALRALFEGTRPLDELPLRDVSPGVEHVPNLRGVLATRGATVVEGATQDDTTLATALAKRQSDLHFCYQRGLVNNPNLQGRVRLSAAFAGERAVWLARPSGDVPDSAVIWCVEDVAREALGLPPRPQAKKLSDLDEPAPKAPAGATISSAAVKLNPG
jgi:hypothetical protein